MTDYDQRQRIVTELAAAGNLSQLGATSIATEVLLYLPPSFLSAYEELFWKAFKPQTSAPIASRGGGIEKASGYGHGPQASGGGKKYKEYWVIVSDVAYRKKLRLDQKLANIAADLEANRDTGQQSIQCSGCYKFLQSNFRFCPWCGEGRESREGRGRNK